jgi:hypothetical protein
MGAMLQVLAGMVCGNIALANVGNAVHSIYVVPMAAVAWGSQWLLREERWLRERFGDEYDAYQARVPRYLAAGMLPGAPVSNGQRWQLSGSAAEIHRRMFARIRGLAT